MATKDFIVRNGLTVSGNATIANTATVTGVLSLLSNYAEEYSNVAISASTLTINLSSSSIFNVNLNSAVTTLTLSSYPSGAGQSTSFILMFTADGTARAVTWPASFRWPSGTAPTLTSTNNKRDVFAFFTIDGGTNWQAFTAGQNL